MVGGAVYYWSANAIEIEKITLASPDNSALKEDIRLVLSEEAPVYVEYWKSGSMDKKRTPTFPAKKEHLIHLLLIAPNSTYQYRVIIDRLVDISSETYTFKTREQSPWLVHDWLKEENPHDASALGDGLVMLCYRGFPGYIAMVDGEGTVRWYWQDKQKGVRLASLTPRNTILALLAPASKDEFHNKKKKDTLPSDVNTYYLRTGKTGFVGGTEIAEIDLEGNVLWRINIEEKDIVFHHDLQMNKDHQILSIYRDYIMHDLTEKGIKKDTLWGDGVMVMDTTGKVVKKWSAWDHWNLDTDKRLEEYSGDRFHFNSLAFDADGNYLLSTPIENQVWKVNATTGAISWKLGKGGDFKMDSIDHFYFQHAAHIDKDGNLMLFDNGDFSPNDTTKVHKSSRTLSFKLDTSAMTATTMINSVLPPRYYTSRMGSAYLMPNDNLLQTSSKTGGVVVTDQKGKVQWAINTPFIPYKAEYVPMTLWEEYIQN